MKARLLAAAAATMLGNAAFAADLPAKKEAPPAPAAASTDGFDLAFGVHIMSDYVSRGISQSAGQPSGTVYFEPRYNIGDTQLYVGTQLWRTNLPTNPFAEVDLYGGIRQTWGKFSVDLGGIYYWYPSNNAQYWTSGGVFPVFAAGTTVLNPVGATVATCTVAGFCATTAKDPSFLELYAKPSYNITDAFSVAANLFWSPNWSNYASRGGGGFSSTYLSVLPKYTFGDSGFSVSGELGYQWLGSLKPGTIYNGLAIPLKFPSFWAYNLGVSYAWNNVTADLRWFGSSLNNRQCYAVSSDPAGNRPGFAFTGSSNWCGQRIVATLSVDFTYQKDWKH